MQDQPIIFVVHKDRNDWIRLLRKLREGKFQTITVLNPDEIHSIVQHAESNDVFIDGFLADKKFESPAHRPESGYPEPRSCGCPCEGRLEPQRLMAIVREQTNLICRFLPDGIFTFVNKSFCRYACRTEINLIGTPIDSVLSNQYEMLQNRNPLVMDEQINHPDGDLKWIHWAERFVISPHSGLIEFQLEGQDVTEAKIRDAEKIKNRERELEDILNKEERLCSLGRISAGIAHEIRNPLSTINVYLKILKNSFQNSRKVDLDTFPEILNEIESASKRIEGIVKRVMDFSRPNSHGLTQLNVNSCIREAMALARMICQKEGVIVEEMLEEGIHIRPLEHQSICQVLLNLITNAVEAMKNNPREKKIRITSQQNEHQLIVCVSDSGPGVPAAIRDQIFNPFFTTKTTGLGIGLSIVRRIIQDHGGEIQVGSNDWGGAEFRITWSAKAEGTT